MAKYVLLSGWVLFILLELCCGVFTAASGLVAYPQVVEITEDWSSQTLQLRPSNQNQVFPSDISSVRFLVFDSSGHERSKQLAFSWASPTLIDVTIQRSLMSNLFVQAAMIVVSTNSSSLSGHVSFVHLPCIPDCYEILPRIISDRGFTRVTLTITSPISLLVKELNVWFCSEDNQCEDQGRYQLDHETGRVVFETTGLVLHRGSSTRVFMSFVSLGNEQPLHWTGHQLKVNRNPPLNVGFIFPYQLHGAPWTMANNLGRIYLEDTLQDAVRTYYFEDADHFNVLGQEKGEEYASAIAKKLIEEKACTMIVWVGAQFKSCAAKMNLEYPRVNFLMTASLLTEPPSGMNSAFATNKLYHAFYLAGMAAGAVTKRHLGFIGSFNHPTIYANANAFLLGARRFNPTAKLSVLVLGTFQDMWAETQASIKLLDDGVDVVAQCTNGQNMSNIFREAGKYIIGYAEDRRQTLGDQVLTSVLYNYGPFFVDFAKRALRNESFAEESRYTGVESIGRGAVLTSFSKVVPHKVVLAIKEVEQRLRRSSDELIFCGTLIQADGLNMTTDSQCLDDFAIRNMNTPLEGVEWFSHYIPPEDLRWPTEGKELQTDLQYFVLVSSVGVTLAGVWLSVLIMDSINIVKASQNKVCTREVSVFALQVISGFLLVCMQMINDICLCFGIGLSYDLKKGFNVNRWFEYDNLVVSCGTIVGIIFIYSYESPQDDASDTSFSLKTTVHHRQKKDQSISCSWPWQYVCLATVSAALMSMQTTYGHFVLIDSLQGSFRIQPPTLTSFVIAGVSTAAMYFVAALALYCTNSDYMAQMITPKHRVRGRCIAIGLISSTVYVTGASLVTSVRFTYISAAIATPMSFNVQSFVLLFFILACLVYAVNIRQQGFFNGVRAKRRMEDEDSFVNYVFHEIRNPLHGVSCALSFMIDAFKQLTKNEKSEELRTDISHDEVLRVWSTEMEDLKIASECCRHAVDVLNRMLDLSKLDSGKLVLCQEIFSPHRVVDSIVKMMRVINPKIEIRGECPTRLVAVGDTLRFRQVLLNLVHNAVKFTKEGLVLIRVVPEPNVGHSRNWFPSQTGLSIPSCDQVEETMKMLGNKQMLQPGNLYVEVCDSGPGVPPDKTDTIFMKYRQARSTDQACGTGLGLSLSQKLVNLMGGHIQITSPWRSTSSGAKFYFRLMTEMKAGDEATSTNTEDETSECSGTSFIYASHMVNLNGVVPADESSGKSLYRDSPKNGSSHSLSADNPRLLSPYLIGGVKRSFDQRLCVSGLLEQLQLTQYLEDFHREGFDHLASLTTITESDFDVMKVKRGHRRMIKAALHLSPYVGTSTRQRLSTSPSGSPPTGGRPLIRGSEALLAESSVGLPKHPRELNVESGNNNLQARSAHLCNLHMERCNKLLNIESQNLKPDIVGKDVKLSPLSVSSRISSVDDTNSTCRNRSKRALLLHQKWRVLLVDDVELNRKVSALST